MLQKTAISTNIKERLDFSCALFDPTGDLVANAPHVPVHLGVTEAGMPLPQMVPEDVRRSMQQRSDWGALLSDPLPAGTANPPQAPETSPHEQ